MTLTAEQLRERKRGIGGSEAGVLLGLSKYSTPLQLYLEKTGQLVREHDDKLEEFRYWGTELEDLIAKRYSKETGHKVRRRNQTLWSDEHEFMLANLDREVVGERRILECKTAGQAVASDWGAPGTDEIPDMYLVQVTHYMLVRGFDRADVAVLFGGYSRDYRIYQVSLNRALADTVLEAESRFWYEHVLPGIPPAPTTENDLRLLYPVDNGETVEAPPEIVEALKQLQDRKSSVKAVQGEIQELELVIKSFMKDNAAVRLTGDGQIIATWKAQGRTDIDKARLKEELPDIFDEYSKRQEFRVLRPKPINSPQEV